MSDEELRKLLQEEMIREADKIMAEVNADPTLTGVMCPEEVHDKLFAQIREYEEKKALERLTEEDRELIRLGKAYKRRRKLSRYFVVAAALVFVLAFSSVCLGKDENIFSLVSRMLTGGEHVIVDSDDAEPFSYIEESEAYEEIEKTYGFSPVKLMHLPDGTTFYEAVFSTDMQGVNMIYEIDDDSTITYVIKPNYREASFGTVIEDEKIQEYRMMVNDVEVTVTKYRIIENGETRWSVRFEYHDVQYFIRINNVEQEDVEKIVEGLYFGK